MNGKEGATEASITSAEAVALEKREKRKARDSKGTMGRLITADTLTPRSRLHAERSSGSRSEHYDTVTTCAPTAIRSASPTDRIVSDESHADPTPWPLDKGPMSTWKRRFPGDD